ncbi:response regulator transcription factor [Paenibacillus sp. HB172176]|uniref:helix-turn-helix transcriptional regulator n=1 Tax=Paenibacillus sp. HB172176 TaxID=2493690 RepID=UPI00143A7FE9|nr:response regulator transcription factor [Paenibacillus sp. HB172176]
MPKFPHYFKRLLLFVLLISILPVLCVGAFSYFYSNANLLDKVTRSKLQLLDQTKLTVEQNIHLIDQSLVQFTTLPVILESIDTALDASNFQSLRYVNQYMEYTMTKEIGIDALYFINLKHSWGIFPDRIAPIDPEFRATYADRREAGAPLPLIIENQKDLFPELAQLGIEDGLLMMKQIPLNSIAPDELIISRISYSQLHTWVAKSENLGNTLILDEGLRVIGSNMSSGTDYSKLEELAADKLSSVERSGYLATSLGNEKVYLFYQKSDYTNWIYLDLVPSAVIRQESRTIGWVTLMISVGVIALLLIFAIRGSQRMYSPVRALFKAISKDKISGADEFDTIGRLVANMKQQIHSQGKDLNKYYVLSLFHGELPANELDEKIHGTHPQFRKQPGYVIFLVQIDTLEHTRFEESDRDLLLFAMMNIVQETLPDDERLSPVAMNRSLVVLLGVEHAAEAQQQPSLIHRANALIGNIRQYLGLSVSIGVSRVFSRLSDAAEACEEGSDALKYRVRYGMNTVLFIEEVEPRQEARRIRYPAALASQLKQAVKLNDEEKAEESLEAFIRALFEQEGSLTDFQVVLIRLLSEILQLHLVENDNASMVLNGQSLPKELLELQTPESISHWFKHRVVGPVTELIREETEQQYKRISDEMLSRVERDEKFESTLESLGMELHYSPAYLSQVFRKETGMPFTDYLTGKRIQAAKKLLLETDESVNDIALKLNYTNAQNFIRSFKRELGMTPGAFRSRKL